MVAANFFLGTTIINLCICMTISFAQAEAVDSESAIKSGVDLVKGLNPWIYPIIVILSAFLVAMIGGALMTSRDAAQDQDCIDKEHAMEVPDSGWGGGGGYGKVHDSAIHDSAIHDRGQKHTGGQGLGFLSFRDVNHSSIEDNYAEFFQNKARGTNYELIYHRYSQDTFDMSFLESVICKHEYWKRNSIGNIYYQGSQKQHTTCCSIS